jgi:predicted nucleic acid-binding protein
VGLILDSSIVVAAERRGHNVAHILEQIRAAYGEIDIGLSVVTVAELVHGAYRAKTDAGRQQRLAFIEEVCRDVPIHTLTLEIARSIGRIEGQSSKRDRPRLRRPGYRSDGSRTRIRDRHPQCAPLPDDPRP